MESLKSLSEGEYNNNADLLGIDTEGADLLGRIARLPKEQQAKAIKQIIKGKPAPSVGGNASSRHEMEQRFNQLPKDIRDGLLNKRLQLADTRFYVVKDISSRNSIDVFQGTDQKGIGLGNIANQKLEKDNWFIMYAIIMRSAINLTGPLDADFTHILPIIRNGEFELEAGNKKLVGLTDNTVFDTRDRHDIPIGFYKLENTKILEPQTEIKMPVKFAAATGVTTFMRVEIVGTSVIPF